MKYVKQFSIILGISFLAELLEILIPLPIAASVYGLVIMLVGLITKLIPLEKVETAADFLVDAMSIMFVPATVGIMASVDTLKEMLQYKSIILENVYRTDLPEGFLKNLKTYVKDYGCGLVACGGEDSFALG